MIIFFLHSFAKWLFFVSLSGLSILSKDDNGVVRGRELLYRPRPHPQNHPHPRSHPHPHPHPHINRSGVGGQRFLSGGVFLILALVPVYYKYVFEDITT